MSGRRREPRVPDTVREAVESVLSSENLEAWWEGRTRWFGGLSPRDVWEQGRTGEVMDFIEKAKKEARRGKMP